MATLWRPERSQSTTAVPRGDDVSDIGQRAIDRRNILSFVVPNIDDLISVDDLLWATRWRNPTSLIGVATRPCDRVFTEPFVQQAIDVLCT